MLSRVFRLKSINPTLPSSLKPRKSCNHRLFSSITYSGGQAISGQGGYYGSGGSRVVKDHSHDPTLKASGKELEILKRIMEEIDILQVELEEHGPEVTSETIALKNKVKKMISDPQLGHLLQRLEKGGEYVIVII